MSILLVFIFAENKLVEVMHAKLKEKVTKLLRKTADNIDAGNSALSDDEATDILKILCHRALSKAEACRHLNVGRSKFDDLVREGRLPKGRKRMGFKELVWYEDELDGCLENK